MIPSRLSRLRSEMLNQGFPALLLTNPFNRRYMTGFTGTSGYVLITEKHAWFLTDFRYMEQAAEQVIGYELVEHQPKPMASVRELLMTQGIQTLAFEQNDVTYGTFLSYQAELFGIQLAPSAGLAEKLRLFKDEAELAVMQDAAKLVDDTFSHIIHFLKPGVSEKEVALEMEMFMRRGGAASSSFDTIVASGERSALPHGVASDRILRNDEFITMDFGAYYNGYCSDLTRTVVLGKADQKHKDIYNIVLEAQLTVLDKLKPGMTGKEGDAIARDIITKAGYGDHFGHGTGHGLGMEIHEDPRVSKLGTTVLEPGMVVTVEPGIYLPGFGGVRIEDDIVMTDTGIRLLTHSSKELLEIS